MLRIAKQTDADTLLSLSRAFTTSFVVEEASFRASLSELLADPNHYLAVIEVETKVVGYVLAFSHLTFYANGYVTLVEEIMVDANYRRQGLGRQLMEGVETWAAHRGSHLIALATRRAASFYETIGYEASATYFRKTTTGEIK